MGSRVSGKTDLVVNQDSTGSFPEAIILDLSAFIVNSGALILVPDDLILGRDAIILGPVAIILGPVALILDLYILIFGQCASNIRSFKAMSAGSGGTCSASTGTYTGSDAIYIASDRYCSLRFQIFGIEAKRRLEIPVWRLSIKGMRSRILFSAVFLLVGIVAAKATPQIPDTLIYKGEEYPIQNDLLYDYFVKFPERNPKKEEERCSALWRGYRSTYEVSDGRIFLKDIVTGVCGRSDASELKKVVPTGGRLAIDWFSGLLLAFYGQNLANPYSLEALDSYEKYSFFQVNNGLVEEVRHFDNKGYRRFKKLQFEAFKKTKEYEDAVKQMTANGNSDRVVIDTSLETWILWGTKKFLAK